METCFIINIDEIQIGNVIEMQQVMLQFGYSALESFQAEAKSNLLFLIDTLDTRSFPVLVIAN